MKILYYARYYLRNISQQAALQILYRCETQSRIKDQAKSLIVLSKKLDTHEQVVVHMYNFSGV